MSEGHRQEAEREGRKEATAGSREAEAQGQPGRLTGVTCVLTGSEAFRRQFDELIDACVFNGGVLWAAGVMASPCVCLLQVTRRPSPAPPTTPSEQSPPTEDVRPHRQDV